MKEQAIKGHLISFFTVLIWGTTFISTKVLLEAYHPVEILFIRFVMGLLALYLIYPKPLKGTTLRQELQFAAAGRADFFAEEEIAELPRRKAVGEGRVRPGLPGRLCFLHAGPLRFPFSIPRGARSCKTPGSRVY